MGDYDLSIYSNPDAKTWSKFFIERTKDWDRDLFRDEEIMWSWFANAMMAMHDHLMGGPINGDHAQWLLERADEIERLREALREAREEIICMSRKWVECEASEEELIGFIDAVLPRAAPEEKE